VPPADGRLGESRQGVKQNRGTKQYNIYIYIYSVYILREERDQYTTTIAQLSLPAGGYQL